MQSAACASTCPSSLSAGGFAVRAAAAPTVLSAAEVAEMVEQSPSLDPFKAVTLRCHVRYASMFSFLQSKKSTDMVKKTHAITHCHTRDDSTTATGTKDSATGGRGSEEFPGRIHSARGGRQHCNRIEDCHHSPRQGW